MNSLPPNTLDRLYELLAERQNGTLTDALAAELDRLLADPAAAQVEREFEASHASLLMAFADPIPARMPADAKSRMEAIGVGLIAPASRSVPRRTGSIGWIAAAIATLIAAVGWLRTPPAPPTPPVVRELSVGEKLAALLKDPATATVTLAAQKEPAAKGASAQAIWNNQKQQGYLRLKGLAQNDPTKEQYQLWIFDSTRETYPIDAGVFDVSQAQIDPATGDTLIPIRPSVPVRNPAAIAVTLEQPGGVVVTTKERLALLGTVN